VALILYALLVIVHNTIAGLQSVPRETTEAASAMGMNGAQLLRKVRLPIASPVVYTGGRTASLQTVGNATLGAFVGGFTLGRFVFQGMAEGSNDLVLLGALGIVALALIFDALGRLLEPWIVSTEHRRRAAAP
jgi:osmoprotectant transport system permease protein